LYGFRRLTTGPDRGGYYHEFFLRGRPDLLRKIARIRVKGIGCKLAPSPTTEPNFYRFPVCREPAKVSKTTGMKQQQQQSMQQPAAVVSVPFFPGSTMERRSSFPSLCGAALEDDDDDYDCAGFDFLTPALCDARYSQMGKPQQSKPEKTTMVSAVQTHAKLMDFGHVGYSFLDAQAAKHNTSLMEPTPLQENNTTTTSSSQPQVFSPMMLRMMQQFQQQQQQQQAQQQQQQQERESDASFYELSEDREPDEEVDDFTPLPSKPQGGGGHLMEMKDDIIALFSSSSSKKSPARRKYGGGGGAVTWKDSLFMPPQRQVSPLSSYGTSSHHGSSRCEDLAFEDYFGDGTIMMGF